MRHGGPQNIQFSIERVTPFVFSHFAKVPIQLKMASKGQASLPGFPLRQQENERIDYRSGTSGLLQGQRGRMRRRGRRVPHAQRPSI